MTKGDFLKWLGQWRHVENIRIVVEQRIWKEDELDRLKDSLEKGGRLQMKTKFQERERSVRWF